MDRIVMHIDVNSAFLSWTAVDLLNKGRNLDIRILPSIVGYKGNKRYAITLAASIPAKKLGIRVPEPIYQAQKKCRNLIVEEPNYELYEKMSNDFHELIKNYTPDYEKISIDECFIEYGPVQKLYGDYIEFANKLKNEIKNKLGFTVNVGIGSNKLLAKMASDFEKPDNVHTLFTNEIEEKMFPLPVRDLYGCGKKSCELLNNLNIKTIGELATSDKVFLNIKLKNVGLSLWDRANGIDNSKVEEYRANDASISKERTLLSDSVDKEELHTTLKDLASSVSFSLRNNKEYSSVVSVVIKYADFDIKRKQRKYMKQMDTEVEISEKVIQLFDELWDGEPIRLLGVKLSSFSDTKMSQMSLFDTPDNDIKRDNLQDVVDTIKNRYGDKAIGRSCLQKKK